MQYIMAFDQGTTSSRCILFNHKGKICGMAQKNIRQSYPKAGWVEHNPMEILSSQLEVAKTVLHETGITAQQISAIGITNQRETTIVWDKNTGEPVYPAIVWQCRRTAEQVKQLEKDGWANVIRSKTGLIPDAYFSATKVQWILQNVPGAQEQAEKGNLLFGTVDTWLIWNLTGRKQFVTDYSNASRTMMFNIHQLCWDKEILDYFNIPQTMLPDVKPSSYRYGMTTDDIFGIQIPIASAAGDQQAALFGQCCFESGCAKNTYGTGCFLLMHTGKRAIVSNHKLLTTIAASTDENIEYVLEGSVFTAGASVQWLRDEMKMLKTVDESEYVAQEVEDTDCVYMVPAFSGLGAPYWDAYARGTLLGLTRGSNRAHIVRAVLEAIAFQTYDVIRAMEADFGKSIVQLKVDGGASANNFIMQFQADLLNISVLRPQEIETTALGAAYLAGLAVGYWKDKQELIQNTTVGRIFQGAMSKEERELKLNQWHRAVERARSWEAE